MPRTRYAPIPPPPRSLRRRARERYQPARHGRRGPLQPVALRAEVSSEVAHDRMHVTLYSEAQHSDPAELAAQTTRALNRALQTARQNKGVIVSQGSRNSYPVYDDKGQQITGWRACRAAPRKAAISPVCRN